MLPCLVLGRFKEVKRAGLGVDSQVELLEVEGRLALGTFAQVNVALASLVRIRSINQSINQINSHSCCLSLKRI